MYNHAALLRCRSPGEPAASLCRLKGHLRTTISLPYLILLLALSVLAPLLVAFSPMDQGPDILSPPDWTHLLGTDDLGRDVCSRLIFGAPMSLYTRLLAVCTDGA